MTYKEIDEIKNAVKHFVNRYEQIEKKLPYGAFSNAPWDADISSEKGVSILLDLGFNNKQLKEVPLEAESSTLYHSIEKNTFLLYKVHGPDYAKRKIKDINDYRRIIANDFLKINIELSKQDIEELHEIINKDRMLYRAELAAKMHRQSEHLYGYVSYDDPAPTLEDNGQVPNYGLSQGEHNALQYLGEQHPIAKTQSDIAAGSGYSREQVNREYVPRLMELGLISHPEGKKRGYVITKKGQDYIDSTSK